MCLTTGQVVGEGKVHANLLVRDLQSGLLTTQVSQCSQLFPALHWPQVAGFAKLAGQAEQETQLSTSQLISAYAVLEAGDQLVVGQGRDSSHNSIGGIRSGARHTLHFTVQLLS